MNTNQKRRAAAVVSLVSSGLLLLLTSCSSTDDDLTTASESSSSEQVRDQKDETWPAADPDAVPAAVKERGDTFVSTISTPGGVFLPGFYDNGWDGNATAPIFSGLVTQKDDGTVIPDLAESWDISDDNLTYTFHLRDGLTFSDGSPLTADDVKFTLTLFNDPAFSGNIDFSNIGIVGADAYKNGDAGDISGINVKDPRTIEISTQNVNPLALTRLGGQVLSKQYYGNGYQKGKLDYLRDLYGKPVGAGPYKLDKFIPGQEIRYVANDRYYDGKPDVGHVIFKFVSSDTRLASFQNGDIDHSGFGTDPETLQALKDLKFADVSSRTISDLGQIWLNNRNTKLSDTRVRQALTYGLDREQIIQAKYKGQGQVADIYAAPTQWSFDDDGVTRYGFDPDKAKQLLDDAGWAPGSDGIRQKDGQRFTLSYLTTDDKDPIIPLAKQNYRDIGIDFVPEVLDSNTAFARFNDLDYEAASFRTDSLLDPDDAVREFGTDDPKINVTGYNNSKATDLIKKGQSTLDEKERQGIYSELYKELSLDPPTILIDYRRSISAWNEHIEGSGDFVTGAGDSAQSLAKLRKKDS
jgi:peptide/nickel transport system substrate-binding protein